MKEATGELSTTVIVVIAIAAVVLIFNQVLLPTFRNSIVSRMHCADAYSCDCGENAKSCNCIYLDEDGNEQEVRCPNNQDEE